MEKENFKQFKNYLVKDIYINFITPKILNIIGNNLIETFDLLFKYDYNYRFFISLTKEEQLSIFYYYFQNLENLKK